MHVEDATTNASYVLMRADQFEKMSALVDGDGVEAMYPLLADIEPDDWEEISHYDRKFAVWSAVCHRR